MPRPAPARAWKVVSRTLRAWFPAPAAASLAALLCACNDPPPPNPTKLSETPNPLTLQKPPPSGKPSPFFNPDTDRPPARSEPQLPPAELAAALAAADEALKIGDETTAILRLRPCANMVPQSARCEGELAMLLLKLRRHRAEARYYLDQTLAVDDKALDDAFYRRFGAAMMSQGLAREASTAYERMIARITPSAADWYLLAEALQGVPERLQDAADAIHKAYELDPTHLDWLRTEAILLGQIPDKIAQAITLFEAYKTKIQDPELLADTDRRIAELRTIDLDAAAAASKQPRRTPRTATPG